MITAPAKEFDAVFRAADPATALALLCARDAALRAGAIHRLCPENVIGGLIVVRSKNSRMLSVPASARLLAAINQARPHCATANTPFVTALGLPPRCNGNGTLNRRLKKIQERVGASGWTWHDLRRTAARELYKKTGNLGLVQSLLGHQSLSASLVYLQAAQRTLDASEVAIFASEEL